MLDCSAYFKDQDRLALSISTWFNPCTTPLHTDTNTVTSRSAMSKGSIYAHTCIHTCIHAHMRADTSRSARPEGSRHYSHGQNCKGWCTYGVVQQSNIKDIPVRARTTEPWAPEPNVWGDPPSAGDACGEPHASCRVGNIGEVCPDGSEAVHGRCGPCIRQSLQQFSQVLLLDEEVFTPLVFV